MPAPTALQHALPAPDSIQDGLESLDLDHNARPSLDPRVPADSAMEIDSEGRPIFAPAVNIPQTFRAEARKVPIPPHRFTPLKNNWSKIYQPLVNHLHLQGASPRLPPSPIQSL
jgi:RNA-binding protein PNO1